MLSLQEVHARLRAKRKESSEIKKTVQDELVNNAHYQQLVEDLKKKREEKKSIENQVWAMASREADRLDLLKLDIKADKEMLSDIALNMYVGGQSVEIIDENNSRWVPAFSVTFNKDVDNVEEPAKPKDHALDVGMTSA